MLTLIYQRTSWYIITSALTLSEGLVNGPGLQHWKLGEFCESQGTFWLPWKHSGYHGNRSPWQQFLSHLMPLLIKFHSLLSVLWALGRFFGCHGNGCQGNHSLDIFQPLWSKGPPTRQISWRSGCKQCQESVTENGSVYIWYTCSFHELKCRGPQVFKATAWGPRNNIFHQVVALTQFEELLI